VVILFQDQVVQELVVLVVQGQEYQMLLELQDKIVDQIIIFQVVEQEQEVLAQQMLVD
tara:strand:- start:176 stop:349 length:174 start_codon:yes stop_codon:yes gene_type:complete